jgi:hypothetical protein
MRGAYETPTCPCPYCGTECEADWADVGVGYVQAGPYHCQACHATEAGAFDETEGREDYDREYGWFRPGSPPGSSANVDDDGTLIDHVTADNLYREKHGEGPRSWNR